MSNILRIEKRFKYKLVKCLMVLFFIVTCTNYHTVQCFENICNDLLRPFFFFFPDEGRVFLLLRFKVLGL